MTDAQPLRIGELFAGCGGLGLGVQAAIGGEVIWVSEIDTAACRVLDARLGVPNLGDITAVNWTTVPPVDVLTGGFPCQDVSLAGNRAGLADDTRSGLWTHFARAIEALHPGLVVIENVRGLLSAPAASTVEPCPWCLGDTGDEHHLRALGAVLGDLADLGYDAQWITAPASAVGAAHRRERVFIAAWPADAGGPPAHAAHDGREWGGPAWGRRPGPADGGGRAHAADADSDGPERLGRLDALERGENGAWGPYEPAVRRWERATGRPAPRPVEPSMTGTRVLAGRFVEWLMGLPDGWVTDLCTRREALRVLGNGVVPQQAAHAVRVLLGLDIAGDVPRGRLLPTPRATDAEKGGPNQRGSSGDLMLPSAVHHLLPVSLLPTPEVGAP